MNLTKMQKETVLNILEKVYKGIVDKIDENTPINHIPFIDIRIKLSDTELSALYNAINKIKREDII